MDRQEPTYLSKEILHTGGNLGESNTWSPSLVLLSRIQPQISVTSISHQPGFYPRPISNMHVHWCCLESFDEVCRSYLDHRWCMKIHIPLNDSSLCGVAPNRKNFGASKCHDLCSQLWNMQSRDPLWLTDSLVKSKGKNLEIAGLLNDLYLIPSLFTVSEFKFIPRLDNARADSVAKQTLSLMYQNQT